MLKNVQLLGPPCVVFDGVQVGHREGAVQRETGEPCAMVSCYLGVRRRLEQVATNTTQRWRHTAAMRPVAKLLWALC